MTKTRAEKVEQLVDQGVKQDKGCPIYQVRFGTGERWKVERLGKEVFWDSGSECPQDTGVAWEWRRHSKFGLHPDASIVQLVLERPTRVQQAFPYSSRASNHIPLVEESVYFLNESRAFDQYVDEYIDGFGCKRVLVSRLTRPSRNVIAPWGFPFPNRIAQLQRSAIDPQTQRYNTHNDKSELTEE